MTKNRKGLNWRLLERLFNFLDVRSDSTIIIFIVNLNCG